MPTRPIRHRSAILRTCAAVVSASLLPSVASATIPTVSWAVDASGQWTTLSNWSPARAINYDDVVIDRPAGTYTVTLSDSYAVAYSLLCNENLTLSNRGSLAIIHTSTINGTLTVASGQLSSGAAGEPLTINGPVSLTGGLFTSNASAILNGPVSIAGGSLEGPGAVTFTGAVALTAGSLHGTGSLYLAPTASLALSSPNWPNWIGNTYNITNAGAITVAGRAWLGAGVDLPTLTNLPGATISKTGTAPATFSLNIANGGLVAVHQGSLTLNAAPTGSGTYTVDPGATLSIGGALSPTGTVSAAGTVYLCAAAVAGSYTAASTVITPTPLSADTYATTVNSPTTTTGTLSVTGYATATFNAPATAAAISLSQGTATFNASPVVDTLSLSQGTLNGSADVSPSAHTDWYSSTLSGTGRLVIPAGGSLSMWGNNTLSRTIDNYGSASERSDSSHVFDFSGGTFNNHAGATYTAYSGSFTNSYGSAFNNEGSFVKAGYYTTQIMVPFNNAGSVSVDGGSLALSGAFTQTGSISVGPAGTLAINGTATVSPQSSITGTGTVQFLGIADFPPDTFNATGPLDIGLGAHVTFNNTVTPASIVSYAGHAFFNAPTSLPNVLLQSFARLDGSADVTLTGTVELRGFLAGTGHTILPAGTSTTVNYFPNTGTNTRPRFSRTIDNYGSFSASTTAKSLYLDGGTFNNLPGATFTTGNIFSLRSDAPISSDPNLFYNAPGATFHISSGLLTADVPFSNDGAFRLDEGIAKFTSPLTNTGSITIGRYSTLETKNTFTNTGTIDLTTSTSVLIIDYADGSPPTDAVRQLLQANLLTSTAADPTHRLAYRATLATIRVQLALAGDANLDGQLTPDDYALLDRSYARSLTNAHWTDGDFNYDGVINQQDYLLIDTTLFSQAQGFSPGFLSMRESQFGPTYVSALLATVPEPTSLFAACGLALLPTHRRRR